MALFSVVDAVPTAYLTLRVINDVTTYLSLQNLEWFFLLILGVECVFAGLAIGLYVYMIWKKTEIRLSASATQAKTPEPAMYVVFFQ